MGYHNKLMPTTSKKSSLRIVYILELNHAGELECSARSTKLMNWEAFSEQSIRFEGLFGKQFEDAMTPEDRKIAMRLLMSCRGQSRDLAVLSGEEGYDLFKTIVDTNRAFWAKGSHLRLRWEARPMPVKLDWQVQPQEYRPVLIPADQNALVLPISPPVYLLPGSHSCGPVSGTVSDGLLTQWAEVFMMDAERARTFCLRLLNRFPSERFPVPDEIEIKEAESAQIVPELTLSRRAGASAKSGSAANLNEMVLVELHFRYGKRRIERDSNLDFVSYTEDETVVRMRRDLDFEAKCINRLESFGFEPAPTTNAGELFNLDAGGYLLTNRAATSWYELLDQVFPGLETAGWKVRYAPGFRLHSTQGKGLDSEVAQVQSWFEYSVGVTFQGIRFSVVELIRDFISNSQSRDISTLIRELADSNLALPMEDGEFLVLPGKELTNIMSEIFELLGSNSENGTVRLSAWRAAELTARGMLVMDPEQARELPDLTPLIARLRGGLTLAPMEPPPRLRAELRDYQKVGLGWLRFLRETGMHGILADDMGLGKTLQTIACLLAEHQAGGLDRPSLIVAPTSLLDNWQSEIERFAPDLTTRIYHGPDRQAVMDTLPDGAIVITTYAVLRNDVEVLKTQDWAYLIVDEA
ncbi:MAG: hypothetical protein EA353_00705, partial [Puniceicoccaceae bacterium]